MTMIPTARGTEVDDSQLGFTLTAENVIGAMTTEVLNNWPDVSFGTPEVQERRIEEAVENLRRAKDGGVDTIVDRTIPGIGRDVPLLKRIAEQCDINILVATGYYTWNQLPLYFYTRARWPDIGWSPHQLDLEDLLVRDIEEGVMDTGVRAAIIKVAVDKQLTDDVVSVLRATARAHRRTGVPITTHTGIDYGVQAGILQHRVFLQEGVDLSRVIIGHCDLTPAEVPLDEFELLLRRGSCLGFDSLAVSDMVGGAVRETRIERIVELCARGYADRLLLAHESSPFTDMAPAGLVGGGQYPVYLEVSRDLIPKLVERGVTDDQVEQMMVRNPRRILASRSLGPY